MATTETSSSKEFLCNVSGGKLYNDNYIFSIEPNPRTGSIECAMCEEPEDIERNPFTQTAGCECTSKMHVKCMMMYSLFDNTARGHCLKHIVPCRVCKTYYSSKNTIKVNEDKNVVKYDTSYGNYQRWSSYTNIRTTFKFDFYRDEEFIRSEIWYFPLKRDYESSRTSSTALMPLLMGEVDKTTNKYIEYSSPTNKSNGRRIVVEYGQTTPAGQMMGLIYKCTPFDNKSYVSDITEYSTSHPYHKNGKSLRFTMTWDKKHKLYTEDNYINDRLSGLHRVYSTKRDIPEENNILEEFHYINNNIDFRYPIKILDVTSSGLINTKKIITPIEAGYELPKTVSTPGGVENINTLDLKYILKSDEARKQKIRHQVWYSNGTVHFDLIQIIKHDMNNSRHLDYEWGFKDLIYPNYKYYQDGSIERQSTVVKMYDQTLIKIEHFARSGKKTHEYYTHPKNTNKVGLYLEWFASGEIKTISEYNENGGQTSIYCNFTNGGEIYKLGRYTKDGSFVRLE